MGFLPHYNPKPHKAVRRVGSQARIAKPGRNAGIYSVSRVQGLGLESRGGLSK